MTYMVEDLATLEICRIVRPKEHIEAGPYVLVWLIHYDRLHLRSNSPRQQRHNLAHILGGLVVLGGLPRNGQSRASVHGLETHLWNHDKQWYYHRRCARIDTNDWQFSPQPVGQVPIWQEICCSS